MQRQQGERAIGPGTMAGNVKASRDCYACLRRLAYQAAELSTEDTRLRKKAVEEGLRALEDNFSTDKVSIVIATRIHNAIRQITGNPDPYEEVKKREIEIAKRLYHDRRRVEKEDFAGCLGFAAWGNTMDFFKHSDSLEEDMVNPVSFVVDDSEHFERKVKYGGRVLYLADNAGEVYFDLPLVKWLGQHAEVVYVVKPSPIQNDVTLEDVGYAGLEGELGQIITTGSATPGIDFAFASTRFVHEFESADLIFAKGMGYYESLTELPAEGKVLHCLRAKCQPVARSLAVPLNSYVAMLR
jgi:uncharacterized protein with ATP-grasp and redox domains